MGEDIRKPNQIWPKTSEIDHYWSFAYSVNFSFGFKIFKMILAYKSVSMSTYLSNNVIIIQFSLWFDVQNNIFSQLKEYKFTVQIDKSEDDR